MDSVTTHPACLSIGIDGVLPGVYPDGADIESAPRIVGAGSTSVSLEILVIEAGQPISWKAAPGSEEELT